MNVLGSVQRITRLLLMIPKVRLVVSQQNFVYRSSEISFSGMNNFTELVSCNGNFFPCLGTELGVGVGMCGGHP